MPKGKIIGFLSNRRAISGLFSLHFGYFLKLLSPYSPSLLKPSSIFYFIVQEQARENKVCKRKPQLFAVSTSPSTLSAQRWWHWRDRTGYFLNIWRVRTELTNISLSVPQNLIYFSINHRDNVYIFMTHKAGERGSCWCRDQMWSLGFSIKLTIIVFLARTALQCTLSWGSAFNLFPGKRWIGIRATVILWSKCGSPEVPTVSLTMSAEHSVEVRTFTMQNAESIPDFPLECDQSFQGYWDNSPCLYFFF